ncbi:TPA: hypothetical protein KKX32_002363 [Legionella pneumophila]|uniref:hypothetical protein n=1 Tax=Legionella pneumophila TaxID=446 RepID=UPI0012B6A6C7|nr:hypothetical protein [Legionella pneumophila]HCC3252080.1 hypothetical protein [Legionella pneumophila subsp. pneumophila]MBN5929844.1 hypothetical protein [Legionella pneumophila]MDF1929957.1 hypothetical protein [Legionella pneumophila]WII17018.1 hypothetical protein PT257_11845 [Legionella pneumophila]HAT1711018.1 hypothetical protein [Legionella pneumophila]
MFTTIIVFKPDALVWMELVHPKTYEQITPREDVFTMMQPISTHEEYLDCSDAS